MKHAIVWIDQHEARIFAAEAMAPGQPIAAGVSAPGPHAHRHPKDQEVRVRNHPDDEHRFFQAVAHALEGPAQILIAGPAQAKLHLFRYLQEHARPVAARVVGIETLDHPSDAQLAAHMRHYFHEDSPRIGVKG